MTDKSGENSSVDTAPDKSEQDELDSLPAGTIMMFNKPIPDELKERWSPLTPDEQAKLIRHGDIPAVFSARNFNVATSESQNDLFQKAMKEYGYCYDPKQETAKVTPENVAMKLEEYQENYARALGLAPDKPTVFSMRMKPDLRKRAEAFAEADGRDLKSLIEVALEKHMRENKPLLNNGE